MKTNSLLTSSLAVMLFLLCCQTPTQAQSPRDVLTWDYFKPSTIDSIGMASTIDIGVSQALVSGNGRYRRDLYFIEVDKDNSLYDPSKVTDWDLRYNQILYDMALLSMKQAIQDNRDGQVGTYEIYGRYRQIYDATKVGFMIRSVSGRDTAVISSYEDSLKSQVAELDSEDFYSAPFILTSSGAVPATGGFTYNSDFTLALMLGYENNCFLSGYSQNFNCFNGFNISAEFRINSKFRFEMQYALLWGKVKTPGFYYDTENEYMWMDKTARDGIIRIGAGIRVLSRNRISLTPFAGVQVSSISQDTGTKDQKGQKIRSYISDNGGAYMGMDIDFHPKRISGIRFRVFGSFDSFDRTAKTWSLNSGFTFPI